MSDGISKQVNFQANFDGSGVVRGLQETKQNATSVTNAIQQDFTKMSGAVDAALSSLVTEINAIDRELNRLGRGVSRGLGPEQFESIKALQDRLKALQQSIRSSAPDNFMTSVATDATIARTNLAYVEQMMNRISSLDKQIASQHGVRGIYEQGKVLSPNDPRYLAALQGDRHAPIPQMLTGGASGQDAILLAKQTEKEMLAERRFYANLQKEEDRKKRQEEREWNKYVNEERRKEASNLSKAEKEDRRELQRYERALSGKDQRSDPLEDVRRAIDRTSNPVGEHPAVQMVREAAAKDEATRERIERARQLDARSDNHYFQQRQSNLQAESQWINRNQPQLTPLVQLDTSNSLDLRYQHQLREEQYRRDVEHQDKMFQREAQKREQARLAEMGRTYGPAAIGPVYGPFPQSGHDTTRYGVSGQRGNWVGGRDNRQFIGQQLAYGADDMFQQYMWANTTAGGISAAARAGGNNLTAAIGATNMDPMKMMAGMIGVQGIAMAISAYARYRDEAEKARVSTKELEKQMESLQTRANQEIKFKYSLEDKDSKSLKADEREAKMEKELLDTGKYKEAADRLSANRSEEEVLKEEQKAIAARVTEASKNIGPGGVPYISGEDTKRSKYITARLASLKEEEKLLSPMATKYYDDSARIEAESEKRKIEIEKKERTEGSRKEREKRSKSEVDNFYADIESEERQSGVMLTGQELKDRFNRKFEDRYDLNLTTAREELDKRSTDKDRSRQDRIIEQSQDVEQRNQNYQSERKYRDDPYGDIRAEFEKEMSRISRDYKMLSPDERGILEDNARDSMGFKIDRKSEEYDKNLRSNYKALSGITSGSEEEAQLRAKLTVDSGMKSEVEKQTKLLEQVAANTKPRQRANQPQVVRMV